MARKAAVLREAQDAIDRAEASSARRTEDELRAASADPSAPPQSHDILILSANESDGLERWLRQNEYRIPDGASAVLRSYIRQDMKF